MKRRPGDRGPGAPGKGFHDRLGQSRDAQSQLISKFQQQRKARVAQEAAEAAEDAARPRWDLEALAEAVGALPLREAGREDCLCPTTVYRRLVEITAASINNGSSAAVMCWPAGDPSPAAVAVLLSLADSAAARPLMFGTDQSFEAPLGLRALIYPYARTVHRALRHLYVDKTYLGRLHIEHQLRSVRGTDDPALEDYHKTIARVGQMTGRASDGRACAEMLHPSLDDLIPSGPCEGTTARSPLLGLVATKTDLKSISRTHVADKPDEARFYLFGLRPDDPIEASLDAVAPSLSVALLDLDYTGRGRFGREWVEPLKFFLDYLHARAPRLPVVALTDDPYAFDVIRFELLGEGKGKRSKRAPCRSEVLFAQHAAIANAGDRPSEAIQPVANWETLGFSGALGPLLERLRHNARKARTIGDRDAAEHLGAMAATLRRCAALPGSVGALGTFLGDNVAAADILTAYRVSASVGALREGHGPFRQHYPEEVQSLCGAVQTAWQAATAGGLMNELLCDVISRFKGVSSKTAVLFPKDMLAEFASSVLCAHEEFGDRLAERVERGMLLFVDRAGFDDLAAQSSVQRNQIKTLIVVAMPRSHLLTLSAQPWLPDRIIVLADCDALVSAARETQRLSRYPDLQALAERFRAFSDCARAEASRLSGAQVALSLDSDPDMEEFDFPLSGVIDLAGNLRAGQSVLQFSFDGGQVIRARPGTKLIVQDRMRSMPIFTEVEARRVEVGDHVCIIGDAFLEMARPLLNISVRAAEEIRDYHQEVLSRFAQIEGDSRNARLTTLIERMGVSGVSVERAQYWVKLEEQLEAPLEDVVPCAPQDEETFLAFAKTLGMTETAARQYWLWAVIAQRRSRLRAAMAFHDAYRGILVDVYAAQSENPERAADIRRLRSAAENHVGVVRSKKEVQ